MRVFFDASAFAKRYVQEQGSEQVLQWCEQSTELALSVVVVSVMVVVRLVSVPPMTTFALGTTVVLEEVLLTDRMVVFSSASPIVKGSALVAVLRATD